MGRPWGIGNGGLRVAGKSRKCEHQIDSYERLEEDVIQYRDMTNQLVSQSPERYRWIRERLVWGMSFPKMVKEFTKTFDGVSESQAVWAIKAELARLSTKLLAALANSKISELNTWRSLQLIYNMALEKEDYRLALDAQKEMMNFTKLYRRKYIPPHEKPGFYQEKPASTKMSASEKKARAAVREAKKQAAEAAEIAAREALQEKLAPDEVQNLTDEELLRKMQQEGKGITGIPMLTDQNGSKIPQVTPEMARALTGGRKS